MNNNRNDLKVGVAVLISLAMLIGGIMWGKGCSVNATRYEIRVDFANVGGLETGANVLANGVQKGRVTDIWLHDGMVTVKAAVDRSVKVYSDYRIVIESPTLMAGKVLSIYPGSAQPTADLSKPLKGDEPQGVGEAVATMQDLAHDLKKTLVNVNALLISFNEIAGDSSNQKHLSELLTNTNEVAKTSNDWLRENRAAMTAALQQLQQTLESADRLVKSADAKLDVTFATVDSTAQQISALSESVHAILSKLQNGEGTMGKLLTDDDLYVRLTATLAEVDSLAKSIRIHGLRNKIVLF